MVVKAPNDRVFHKHGAPNYYTEQLHKATSDGRITDEDRNLILQYIDWRHSNRPITGIRKTKIECVLVGWRRFIKAPWQKCTIEDIRRGMNLLSESDLSQNTRHDYWKDLKPFMLWLRKKGKSKINADDLKEIHGAGVNTDCHSAVDLLSLDEIEAITRAAGSSRNRAIIALLFESAARIYELSRLKWQDVDFSNPPLIQLVLHDTKTKKRRYAPLIRNTHFLGVWRNEYKAFTGKEPAPEDYVFVDENGLQMLYPAMRQIIVRAAEKAGLNGKRVHPHLLRASAITQLIREDYRESTVREVAWGNQGTGMFKHYLKLSQDDINREFRQKAGIETPEDKAAKPRLPIICPFCSHSMPPSAKFCLNCGAALTVETRKQVQTDEERLFEQFKKFMADQKTKN